MFEPLLKKIYTRTGDKGETGLAGGRRVPKDDPRIECLGTVDELNCCVGVARGFVREMCDKDALRQEVEPLLEKIQRELLAVCADLAVGVEGRCPHGSRVGPDQITDWEKAIDKWSAGLPVPGGFILPGGGRIAASLHLARSVCRRAERRCVALTKKSQINPFVVPYLNRLSDALFVLARWICLRNGEPEFFWKRR